MYFIKETKCKSIDYNFRRDHEISSFRKLARNKCICQETCDFFGDQFTLLAINSIILNNVHKLDELEEEFLAYQPMSGNEISQHVWELAKVNENVDQIE